MGPFLLLLFFFLLLPLCWCFWVWSNLVDNIYVALNHEVIPFEDFFFFSKKMFRELEELKHVKFDMSMMNFPGKFEGPAEKKLRETGEWMTDLSERGFNLSSKY